MIYNKSKNYLGFNYFSLCQIFPSDCEFSEGSKFIFFIFFILSIYDGILHLLLLAQSRTQISVE